MIVAVIPLEFNLAPAFKKPEMNEDAIQHASPRESNVVEARNVFSVLRGVVEHEDNLINHRFNWLLVTEGLLIAGTADGVFATSKLILIFAAIAGIALAVMFGLAIKGALNSIAKCEEKWRKFKSENNVNEHLLDYFPQMAFKTSKVQDYTNAIYWISFAIIPIAWIVRLAMSFAPALFAG